MLGRGRAFLRCLAGFFISKVPLKNVHAVKYLESYDKIRHNIQLYNGYDRINMTKGL